MFKTPNSGLTYFDPNEHIIGAYKTHTYDPILFHNGMELVFRNFESTKGCGSMECCPNQFCRDGESFDEEEEATTGNNGSHPADHPNIQRQAKEKESKSRKQEPPTEPVVYSSLVWYYVWDDDDEQNLTSTDKYDEQSKRDDETRTLMAAALVKIAKLRGDLVISAKVEDAAMDRLLLKKDTQLGLLLTAYADAATSHSQTARILVRYLENFQ
jgi:hypothetical protein